MIHLILCIIFMALGAISLALFLVGKLKGYSVKETLIKSIASLFFIATAAVSLYYKGAQILALFVTIGLIFGLTGDIWLELKYVFRQDEKLFTYAGFIAFAIGHMFYIPGMYLQFYNGDNVHVLFIIIPLVLGLIAGIANLFLSKLLKMNFGEYKVICVIYGVLLFSMFFVTLSLNIMHGFASRPLNLLFAGGILFVVSDLILSGTYFGEGKDRPVDLISNAVTYYLAQYVIAFSLFFI